MPGESRNGSTDIKRATRINNLTFEIFKINLLKYVINSHTDLIVSNSAVNSIFLVYHGYLKHIFLIHKLKFEI